MILEQRKDDPSSGDEADSETDEDVEKERKRKKGKFCKLKISQL